MQPHIGCAQTVFFRKQSALLGLVEAVQLGILLQKRQRIDDARGGQLHAAQVDGVVAAAGQLVARKRLFGNQRFGLLRTAHVLRVAGAGGTVGVHGVFRHGAVGGQVAGVQCRNGRAHDHAVGVYFCIALAEFLEQFKALQRVLLAHLVIARAQQRPVAQMIYRDYQRIPRFAQQKIRRALKGRGRGKVIHVGCRGNHAFMTGKCGQLAGKKHIARAGIQRQMNDTHGGHILSIALRKAAMERRMLSSVCPVTTAPIMTPFMPASRRAVSSSGRMARWDGTTMGRSEWARRAL